MSTMDRMPSGMLVNNSLTFPSQSEVNVTAIGNWTGSALPGSTSSPYDHLGAMKFTVAVVLVYGIGVIGVLGIYARKRSKHRQDRDANTFLKGLQKHREMAERSTQMSAVQNLIGSIQRARYEFAASAEDSPAAAFSVQFHLTDCTTDAVYIEGSEGRPLMSRRHALPRSFSPATADRRLSIPETEADDVSESRGFIEIPGFEYGCVDIDGGVTLGTVLLHCDSDLASSAPCEFDDNSCCNERIKANTKQVKTPVCGSEPPGGFPVTILHAQER